MGVHFDVVRRAGDLLAAAGSVERRRAAFLGGVNFIAVALGIGALHLGGALVGSGGDHQPMVAPPSPVAIVKSAQTPISIPHSAPMSLTAVPDDLTLFAAPVVSPTVFAAESASSGGGLSAPPATSLGPSPASVVAEIAPPPAVAVPEAKAVTKLATTVHAVHHAVAANFGSLALSDAMLDAPVTVAAATNTGVTAAANSVAATANGVAAAANGVAAGVSGVAAGVSAGVGATAAAAAGTAAGVAGVASSAAAGVSAGVSSAAAGVSAGVGAAAGAR
jgi:hypothetical protein